MGVGWPVINVLDVKVSTIRFGQASHKALWMWLTKFATLNNPSKYLDPTTYQYNCFFNAIFKQKEILLHCNSWWVYRCKSPRYKSWEDAITSATQKWSVCLLHQLNASYNLNMVMLNRNFLFQRLIFKFHIHTYFHIDTITTKKDMPKKRAHTHTHLFFCVTTAIQDHITKSRWCPNPSLLLMEEILHQLIWYKFPLFTKVSCMLGGCLGFLNHQQYYFPGGTYRFSL